MPFKNDNDPRTQQMIVARDLEYAPTTFSLRAYVATGFRYRKLVTKAFLVLISLGLAMTFLLPRRYEAKAQFLVKRQRPDSVVSVGSTSPIVTNSSVAPEDLNSEVELLKSEDVLRRVVVECGLAKRSWLTRLILPNPAGNAEQGIAEAIHRLAGDLKVEALNKTNVIEVRYASASPGLSQNVMATLVHVYLDKHLAVHRLAGQFEFFDQQTQRYNQELAEAEAKLSNFSKQGGSVAPQSQRDSSLQKLNDFNANLQQTRSSIAETEARIRSLEKQREAVPVRITTQLKDADNPQLFQELKGTLLKLQLKRTELLSKYQPTYRPVVELEEEIAATQAAIATAERRPLRDQTTDINPTYQWVVSELAKARSELKSLQSRANATESIVKTYDTQAHALNEQQITYQDLTRTAKAAEDNYLLYLHKTEEARITDALDNRRLLNVSVLEEPSRPYFPVHSRWFYLIASSLLSVLMVLGLIAVLEIFDDSFRTPGEVEQVLKVPVLAAFPSEKQPFLTGSVS